MDLPAHDVREGGSSWFSTVMTGLSDAMLLVLVVLL
jgi:hypothetical protein